MLIEFTLKNYASFKEETTLSAETGARLRKLKETNTFMDQQVPVLKSLLLFGPNGSGKSKLIAGLGTMQNIVTRPTQAVTDRLPYNPFEFSEDTKNADTYFEVKIELNKEIYDYSFSYNQEKINQEKLVHFKGNREKIIFNRDNDGIKVKNKSLEDTLTKLRDNELLLYLAQSENDQDSVKVFRWFTNDLLFINGGVKIPENMLSLMENEYLKKEMISFLSFADFNIVDIEVRDVPAPQLPDGLKELVANNNISFPKTIKYLYTIHKVYEGNKVIGKQRLPLSSESIGTQRLIYIVLAMMRAQISNNRKTIIIDEFDDSLHQELASALVKIFNSKESLNQFIITTHDLQLLDNNLRIDQIYLVDKDFHGESKLDSIFDFDDTRNIGRNDISFAKRYMQGIFGALPVIDVDGLKDVLKATHENIGEKHGKKAKDQSQD